MSPNSIFLSEYGMKESRTWCANSGSMKCFECGDVGHKRMPCPHEAQNSEEATGPSDAVDVANGSVTPSVSCWRHE